MAAGVHTLLLQFCDLNGHAKGKWLPLSRLEDVLTTGGGFAGPSIVGTGLPRHGPRSEFYARGDPATLQALPWAPGFARIVGDGWVGGQPFEACPRQVLRRAVQRLADRGWTLDVGLEPEFFLLRRQPGRSRLIAADALDALDKPSYDLQSLPRQAGFLLELGSALEACGLAIEQIDHEDAQSQYELNFRHADALTTADRLMLFRLAGTALAEARGLVFSNMPKPFADQPGSGLHAHVSLRQGETPLFEPDSTARAGSTPLSSLGRHFMAGVLAHSTGLCALAAPTVNSYKRLLGAPCRSGTSWAPAQASHGPNNRSALIRTLPGRFEWRLPDASANPYLMLAGMIAAGLDGVDRALEPPAAVEHDLYAASTAASQGDAQGSPASGAIGDEADLPQRLPGSLPAALDALEADPVLSSALGPVLIREFLALKRDEWRAYATQVSDWEHVRYGSAT